MIKLIALRALWFGDRQFAAGELLRLDAEQACDALDTGRAELVDADDERIISAARKTRRARLEASLPRMTPAAAPAAGPWFPAGGRY
jgi:hypothetical protein